MVHIKKHTKGYRFIEKSRLNYIGYTQHL